jgi:hypothetical protein
LSVAVHSARTSYEVSRPKPHWILPSLYVSLKFSEWLIQTLSGNKSDNVSVTSTLILWYSQIFLSIKMFPHRISEHGLIMVITRITVFALDVKIMLCHSFVACVCQNN